MRPANLDLAYFKVRLEQLKQETLEMAELVESSSQPVKLDQNSVGRLSRMDAMQGQAMAQASADRQQQLVSSIDSSLRRIENGDYGRCCECDEWIAVGRLKIDPTAECCIVCAALNES